MIPAVPLIVRGALGITALFLAMVLGMVAYVVSAIADGLDGFAHWLVPEVGAKPLTKRRREP